MDVPNKIKITARDVARLLLNPRFIGPCLAGAFCLTVATVVGISYLFTMATALLSLPVASYLIGSIGLKKWSVCRESRIIATQEEKTALIFRITSQEKRVPQGILVRDNLPQCVIAEEIDGTPLPEVENPQVHVWVTPLKRGRYSIGPALICAWDPLGMFRLKRENGEKSELIVYPKPVRISAKGLSHSSTNSSISSGSDQKATRGNFAGIRDYRDGDELKRIHWKTTARTQKLTVIEYEDSSEESAQIMLDLSEGSDFGKDIVTSIDTATGAVAYAVRENLKCGRQVRLIMPEKDEIKELHIDSLRELHDALNALADARANASVTAADLLRSCSRTDNVLLVATRSDSHLSSAVRDAIGRGIRVSIAMVDPTDYDPRRDIKPQVEELIRSGADVELVRGGIQS